MIEMNQLPDARDLVFEPSHGSPNNQMCNQCGFPLNGESGYTAEIVIDEENDSSILIMVCSIRCADHYRMNPKANLHILGIYTEIYVNQGNFNIPVRYGKNN